MLSKTTLSIYGMLGLPLALVGYPIAIWLPAFYAGEIGVSLAAVATMLLVAKLSDVVTDPLVGTISDRLRTPFGRRRPLILLGVPVLCGSIWLLFVPMEEADSVYLLLCIAGMYIGTTLVGLPYGAWGAELSPDYHQRARVTAWREQFTLIGLLVAAFIPFLVEQYGAGDTPSIMRGMALAICISTPIAVLMLSLFVKETEPTETAEEARAPFIDGVKKVWVNKPMRMVIGLILIVTLAEAFRNALSLFFMKAVIQADGVGTLYFIYFTAGLAAVPGWLWLGRKLGKHVAFAGTLITVAIISAINMFFTADDYWLFVVFFIFKGACFGGLQFLPLAILADVIDVETAETGKARAGAYIAFASMTAKISTALGTFLAIRALSFTDFNAKLMAENAFDDLFVLRVLYAIAPAVFFIGAIIIALRFPLTAKVQAELQARIKSAQNA
ncbi:MFS transporter [Alphaproteobacteria bacterium]|nr:MFS transporter [Alphaproteobacteria bacterium]MDB2405935.1 MFS transporter [Alphaproteobacteria bacterium]MDB2541507.1 MFS transporter [Alphaproteobacteria bacterium]MDB2626444.1 MFS transporter [Alphaproteobacteria bacterium]MDB2699473.1 MFS transporter [Alphaproteobacteria bacterium]